MSTFQSSKNFFRFVVILSYLVVTIPFTFFVLFSAVEKEVIKSAHFPFTQSNLIVKLRPIKDIRDMSILWTVDPTRNLYRSNPCRLIGFLLGTYTLVITICLNLSLNTPTEFTQGYSYPSCICHFD